MRRLLFFLCQRWRWCWTVVAGRARCCCGFCGGTPGRAVWASILTRTRSARHVTGPARCPRDSRSETPPLSRGRLMLCSTSVRHTRSGVFRRPWRCYGAWDGRSCTARGSGGDDHRTTFSPLWVERSSMSFRTLTACALQPLHRGSTSPASGWPVTWIGLATKRRLPLTRSAMEAETPSTTQGAYETDARYRTAPTHSDSRSFYSRPKAQPTRSGVIPERWPRRGWCHLRTLLRVT